MNEDAETLQKISKLQKENKNLQILLESAESEMKSIVEKSQEESNQLQKVLQTVLPKLQHKIQNHSNSGASTASVDRSSKGIQTENTAAWTEHLQDLQTSLKSLEKVAMELVRTQNLLQVELQEAQKKEELILHEVSENQQQILDLEIEIAEYKKQLLLMQDEFQILYQHIFYESQIGIPIPSIFAILT